MLAGSRGAELYETLSESSLEAEGGPDYDAITMINAPLDIKTLALEMPDLDQERRRELRTFLMHARAELGPSDVGRPHTRRRRVPGLRRGEVAELIGVTCDWYRWFEGGRQIRVSPRFVLRLIGALRLCEQEALTLYQLAIPEMYITTRRVATESAA